MLIDLIRTTEIGGVRLFAVDAGAFQFIVIAYAALLASIPYLANKAQPTPKPIGWHAVSTAPHPNWKKNSR